MQGRAQAVERGPQTPICCWDCSGAVANLDFQSKSGALPAFLAVSYTDVSPTPPSVLFSLEFPGIRFLLWGHPLSPRPGSGYLREGGPAPPPCLPPPVPRPQPTLPLPRLAGRSHSLLRPAGLPPPPGLFAPGGQGIASPKGRKDEADTVVTDIGGRAPGARTRRARPAPARKEPRVSRAHSVALTLSAQQARKACEGRRH